MLKSGAEPSGLSFSSLSMLSLAASLYICYGFMVSSHAKVSTDVSGWSGVFFFGGEDTATFPRGGSPRGRAGDTDRTQAKSELKPGHGVLTGKKTQDSPRPIEGTGLMEQISKFAGQDNLEVPVLQRRAEQERAEATQARVLSIPPQKVSHNSHTNFLKTDFTGKAEALVISTLPM